MKIISDAVFDDVGIARHIPHPDLFLGKFFRELTDDFERHGQVLTDTLIYRPAVFAVTDEQLFLPGQVKSITAPVDTMTVRNFPA
jgi:hypothetical protein